MITGKDTKWTDQQWEAITARNCSLLVAAAAGSGKTSVLVERIIHRIIDKENPVDIDRLLVVTFTKAAASEMKERIAKAVTGILENNPESVKIQRQLSLLPKASISTIHSFCLEVIRSNFEKTDIDPGFRIADETESLIMKLEAMKEVFEEQYEHENPVFMELLEGYGGSRDDSALQSLVMSIHDFTKSSPWPESWLDEKAGAFMQVEGTGFEHTEWCHVLIESARLTIKGIRQAMNKAVNILKIAEGLEKYLPVFEEDLVNIDELLRMQCWDSLYNALQNIEFKTLPRCSGQIDFEKQDRARKIRDEAKTEIRALRDNIFISNSSQLTDDLKSLYPKVMYLGQMVKEMGVKYAHMKDKKCILDFNDLEHFCLKILTVKDEKGRIVPSKTALEYRERFEEILVDEYQDSNMVQEMIVSMISRADYEKPNVFMVGDVKQSIYRFRQSKPELFLNKYKSYENERGKHFRKIMLFKNFRSRKEIIDAVNYLFENIMSVDAGELDYTKDEALNAGAEFTDPQRRDIYVGGAVELSLLQTGENDSDNVHDSSNESVHHKEYENDIEEGSDNDNRELIDNIQFEARMVAKKVLLLMNPDESGKAFCVLDRGNNTYRKVEYRDIVILLRTTRNWAEVFEKELSVMGIPCFADTGTGFFKTSEVLVMLSLLQVIDNPLQDIPLLSVLRSPIGDFSADELATIRLSLKSTPFFEAMEKTACSGKDQINIKCSEFLDKLGNWREMSLFMTVDKLLWHLYNDTGYFAMLGGMLLGDQRQANLRILAGRARQFEETSFKGLFNFISYIERVKNSRGDMGSAKMLGENENVLRIMSIHKSKGLEFPVVIVSGCGKRFNLQDLNKNLLLHQDLGFGPDVTDIKLRISWPSAAKTALKEKIRIETLSEEMRILYVAMTRAREKLIITGTVKDGAKAFESWEQVAGVDGKIEAFEVLKGRSFLDWVGPLFVRGNRSFLSFKLWYKADLAKSIIDSEQKEDDDLLQWLKEIEEPGYGQSIPGVYEELDRRLGWTYPFEKSLFIPAKLTVTELKRLFSVGEYEQTQNSSQYSQISVKKPQFLQEKKGLDFTEKGTVMHFVMQHIDLSRDDLDSQLDEMVKKDMLTPLQRRSADIGKINAFLKSGLGRRMLVSPKISREVPFNIELPCFEIYGEMGDESYRTEKLLLQGIIDVFFEEPEGLVLIDYKTDYVPEGKTEIIKERYATQIRYYARALEMLTGKRVIGRYIYLFFTGDILEFD